jgi:uncharacterized protein (DUF2062 family)
MANEIFKKIEAHFKEVGKIKKSPHEIALGFSIGTFIAIFPTFGLGFLIGIFIILLFKNISKISLFLALLVWNPLVLIPIYSLGYDIGNFFLAEQAVITFKIQILDATYSLVRRALIGNSVLAFIISFISYFVILIASTIYQRKKR